MQVNDSLTTRHPDNSPAAQPRLLKLLSIRRIWLEFLVILGVLAFSIYLYCQRLNEGVDAHRDQMFRRGIASELAEELARQIGDTKEVFPLDFYRASKIFTDRYPEVDPYVLDNTGKIVFALSATSRPSTDSVSLGPIRQFLDGSVLAEKPIFGDDPASAGEHVVFSAAPISAAGLDGYVYIPLHNKVYRLISRSALDHGHWRAFYLFGSLSLCSILFLELAIRLSVYRRLKRIAGAVGAFFPNVQAPPVPERRMFDFGGPHLESYERQVVDLVTDIAKDTAALKGQEKELKNIIAQVSHDFRTPLHFIQNYADQLLADDQAPPEQIREAERIQRNVKSLFSLLADLVEFYSVPAGKLPLQSEFCRVEELLNELILVYGPHAWNNQISLSLDAPEGLAPVRANIPLLERALRNLLDNAIRHTAPGGSVRLAASARPGDYLRISVSDTGCGIPVSELPYIFEPFRQVSGSNRRNGGSGLGLAIVQNIIAAHGSVVCVESKELVGTTFWFDLLKYDLQAPADSSNPPNADNA